MARILCKKNVPVTFCFELDTINQHKAKAIQFSLENYLEGQEHQMSHCHVVLCLNDEKEWVTLNGEQEVGE